jgi:uncharacterized membrane protein SirB2
MAKQYQQKQYQQQAFQGIKTKKFQLNIKDYTKIAMISTLRKLWWVFLVSIAIILPGLYWLKALPWLAGTSLLLTGIFVLLMWAFFRNMNTLPQGKMLFEKVFYLFDNQGVKVMVKENEGMDLKYEMIKSVQQDKTGYTFFLTPVQFFKVPFSVFSSENDQKLAEAMLRRRKMIS